MKPSDYGLPHNAWRERQEASVAWCLDVDGVGITEAPCGSGKTAYAAAVASQKSVIALCRTKNLQVVNYADQYGFDYLVGRANYPCVHPDAVHGATCADCLHQDNMYQCAVSRSCEYLSQKALCKTSPRVSLNYSYWMTASWPRENPPQVLFLDECHELADVVTSFCGMTVTERDRIEWELSEFPELKPGTGGGMLTKTVDPLPVAMGWLEDTRNVLRRHWTRLKNARTGGELKRKQRCEQLGRKVGNTLEALRRCPDDWYIRSGRRGQKYGREWRPALVVKPLTARHHAPGYFLDGHSSIMMSATVGDFDTFAAELGIGEFESLVAPNQYKAEERPVYVLDTPSMGTRASESAFELQADAIAEAVLDCPGEWSGIIHVTRKRESGLLADRLARRGLQDRVWVPPGSDGEYAPTDKQVKAWERRKAKAPNSIAVSWSMWTGYDGLDERICICAKVPYPIWGSGGSYEAVWRGYSMSRYRWQAANTLAQGLGRTRRGRDEDYDIDGGFNGFVALADGAYGQIRKSLPGDLREALVEF